MHFHFKIFFIFSLCLFYVRALRTTFQSSLTQDTTSTTSTTSTQQWTAVTFLNDAPDQRRGHSSIVMGTQLWIFGGCYLDQQCYNDLHSFDTQTKTWTTLKVNGIPPSAREGHTATVVGSKMYLFGGSGSSGYYNDLYTLDLETQTWTALTLQGTKPAARANHGAIVDLKGRIIIFGGFTENGYANDVYIIDPVEQQWGKPFISGTAPVARESFSMTRVRNAVWIYGGFTDGGVLSDLVILDLDSMSWNTATTSGTQPSGRQGHGAILQENNLIIFGGCNYKINTCYSDTYNLNIDSLWWSKINDANTQAFTGREGFSSNVMGADIYVFGGCLLYESCYNDMIVYDTGVACPNDCNNNGVCRNDRCVCTSGYYDNDCSLAMTCTNNCNGHGQCRTNGKCACYASYTGDSCDIFVNCPLNCTDEAHGICQTSGECNCNPGFSGDGCQDGTAIILTCPNDCSGHGTCDTTKGICVCDINYSGDDCSQTVGAAAVIASQEGEKEEEEQPATQPTQTQETQETQETTQEPETPEEQAQETTTTPPAEESAEESEPEPATQPPVKTPLSKQVSSTPSMTTTTSGAVTTLTPQMFGEPSVSEQKLQKQNEVATLIAEANNCPNSCSYIGLCRNNVCYCTNGYTGEDCSEANIDNLGKGESIEKTMEYAGAFFILGAIIGVFIVFTLVSKANIADYMDIEERKEVDD